MSSSRFCSIHARLVGRRNQKSKRSDRRQLQDPPDDHEHDVGDRLDELRDALLRALGNMAHPQSEQDCEDHDGQDRPRSE